MTRVSITRKISVRDPSLLPTWRQGMGQWEWKELLGTAAFSGQQPTDVEALLASGGLSGRLDAWNGFCATDRAVYIAGMGGHADYFGNEAYKLDLDTNSPAWVMLREPSAAADVLLDSLYYADGRPTSTHLYYNLHAVGNELIRVRVDAASGSGNFGGTAVDAFSLTTNDWRRNGIDTMYPTSPASSLARAHCSDPRDGTIYLTGGTHIHKRHPTTGAWTQLAAWVQNGSATYYRASAVDTFRDRVVFFGDAFRPPRGGFVYDILTNVLTEITFTSADGNLSADAVAAQAGNTAWYLPGIDRFIVKTAVGNKIFLVNPTTWVVTEQATTGGAAIVDAMNGVLNKFVQVPGLGGVFYQPRHSSNGWFLATE